MPERYLVALKEAIQLLREAAKIEFDPDAPKDIMREAMQLRAELLQRGTAILNEATSLMESAVMEHKAARLDESRQG